MNVKFLIKQSEKLVGDNAPIILSSVAVVGTVATAYLAVRATSKAISAIEEKEDNGGLKWCEMSKPVVTASRVKLTWVYFLPPIGAAAATIGCIACAHHITAGRVAGMAAAYSLSEGKFKEYKTAIEKKIGVEQTAQVEREIIQEKVAHGPSTTIILGDGELLCFDAYSGRYFHSTKAKLDKAANEINLLVLKENYQTLDDFWDLIGMEATAYGQEQGWTADCPLEVTYSTMMSSDDKPCLVVHYDVEPLRRWNHLG